MDAARTLKLDDLDLRYAELRLEVPELGEAMRASIERHGLLQPLVANATADGAWVLLDGFKRLGALRKLGQGEAPVRVVVLDDAAAQAAILTHNAAHRGLSELEEAWVVCSLVRTCGMKQVEVAELLGRDKSWVCRRVLFAERLSEPLQQDLRLGLLNSSMARELARLPRGNQERVGQAVTEHGLTARQTAALVGRALDAVDTDSLDAVLQDPLRFVGAPPSDRTGSLVRDPRLSTSGEALRQSLLRWSGASSALKITMSAHPRTALTDVDATVLDEVAREALEQAKSAVRRVNKLVDEPPR